MVSLLWKSGRVRNSADGKDSRSHEGAHCSELHALLRNNTLNPHCSLSNSRANLSLHAGKMEARGASKVVLELEFTLWQYAPSQYLHYKDDSRGTAGLTYFLRDTQYTASCSTADCPTPMSRIISSTSGRWLWSRSSILKNIPGPRHLKSGG